jgi:hypothetical protein
MINHRLLGLANEISKTQRKTHLFTRFSGDFFCNTRLLPLLTQDRASQGARIGLAAHCGRAEGSHAHRSCRRGYRAGPRHGKPPRARARPLHGRWPHAGAAARRGRGRGAVRKKEREGGLPRWPRAPATRRSRSKAAVASQKFKF